MDVATLAGSALCGAFTFFSLGLYREWTKPKQELTELVQEQEQVLANEKQYGLFPEKKAPLIPVQEAGEWLPVEPGVVGRSTGKFVDGEEQFEYKEDPCGCPIDPVDLPVEPANISTHEDLENSSDEGTPDTKHSSANTSKSESEQVLRPNFSQMSHALVLDDDAGFGVSSETDSSSSSSTTAQPSSTLTDEKERPNLGNQPPFAVAGAVDDEFVDDEISTLPILQPGFSLFKWSSTSST
jgi:hypothetical protein